MADALASGASVLRDVGVQVPLRPQGVVWAVQRQKVRNSKGFLTFAFGSSFGDVARIFTDPGLRISRPDLHPKGMAFGRAGWSPECRCRGRRPLMLFASPQQPGDFTLGHQSGPVQELPPRPHPLCSPGRRSFRRRAGNSRSLSKFSFMPGSMGANRCSVP